MGDICKNRHGGNPESVAAHDSLGDVKTVQKYQVLQFVHAQAVRGATTEEVSVALGMPIQTASARMADLKAYGMLEATNERRPTMSGRSARVIIHPAFLPEGV